MPTIVLYACHLCAERFSTVAELRNHLWQEHRYYVVLKCR